MVFYDMQAFGGLEEYAVNLAIGLKQKGHQLSILSTACVPADNQYYQRLRENQVLLIQPPKWISYPLSDWGTKERILSSIMWLLTPFVYLLGIGLYFRKGTSWHQSIVSARGWLNGQILGRFVGPDRREPMVRLLLNWWKFRWKPDLLHLHGYTTNLLFIIGWGYDHHLPVVYEEHQTPDSQFAWWQDFQTTINKANIVVAVSEKSSTALRDVCGVTRPIIVRNPLLADPLQRGWMKDDLSNSADELIRISTVARLYVTKGLTYLLDTIVKVNKVHPYAQFQVYGDGPMRQELLEYAQQLGLDGSQIFVGAFSQQELPDIMAKTDIFVLSSILEGQPLALIEAMAYGCPIVSTSVGGIGELIYDGVNGMLCQPRDPSCLAEKINCLIENPELRKKLGESARNTYEQGPFQPASVSDHFVSIYQQALLNENAS